MSFNDFYKSLITEEDEEEKSTAGFESFYSSLVSSPGDPAQVTEAPPSPPGVTLNDITVTTGDRVGDDTDRGGAFADFYSSLASSNAVREPPPRTIAEMESEPEPEAKTDETFDAPIPSTSPPASFTRTMGFAGVASPEKVAVESKEIFADLGAGASSAIAHAVDKAGWVAGKALDLGEMLTVSPMPYLTGKTAGEGVEELASVGSSKLKELGGELSKAGMEDGLVKKVIQGIGGAIVDVPILTLTGGALGAWNFAAHGFVDGMMDDDDDILSGLKGGALGKAAQLIFNKIHRVFPKMTDSLVAQEIGIRGAAGATMGGQAYVSGLIGGRPLSGEDTVASIITGALMPTGAKGRSRALELRRSAPGNKAIENIKSEWEAASRRFTENEISFRELGEIRRSIVDRHKELFRESRMTPEETLVEDFFGRNEWSGFEHSLELKAQQKELKSIAKEMGVKKETLDQSFDFVREMGKLKRDKGEVDTKGWEADEIVAFRLAEKIHEGQVPGAERFKRLVEWGGDDYATQRSAYTETAGEMGFVESYTRRVWDLEKFGAGDVFFGKRIDTSTARSKRRKIPTIAEGMELGLTRKVKSGLENLRIYKDEIQRVVSNREFVRQGFETGIFSLKKQEGYAPMNPDVLTKFGWFAKAAADAGKGRSTKFAVQSGENIFTKFQVFAPEKIAKWLNNVYQDAPSGVISKVNDAVKGMIFVQSLFHPAAFVRSYYHAGSGWSPRNLNPMKVYKNAKAMINQSHPLIEMGMRYGHLTVGRVQEWQAKNIDDTWGKVGSFIEKAVPGSAPAVRMMGKAYRGWTDFTFSKLGAGLKSKVFALKVEELVRKYGSGEDALPLREIFKIAGKVTNDDFGGLNLQQFGRGARKQRAIRNFFLAPDWTESNVRTVLKMSGALTKKFYPREADITRQEVATYRAFWGQVLTKQLAIAAATNMAVWAFAKKDPVAEFKKGWRDSGLKWVYENYTHVDIGPVLKSLGANKYGYDVFFDTMGHFADPGKWFKDPPKSMLQTLKNKSSWVVGRMLSAIEGKDWAGRRYKGTEALVDDGVLGGFTHYDYTKSGAIELDETPAFILDTIKSFSPIPLQGLYELSHTWGEMSAIESISQMVGLRVRVKE
jgi:hypothetical protein